MAAITGSVPPGWGVAPMTVKVTLVDEDGGANSATVAAVIRPDNTWKVLLPPRPTFGNYSLTATCTTGCSGPNATATKALVNLTFGDVYVCAGQSNMQLMLDYTFERNASIAGRRLHLLARRGELEQELEKVAEEMVLLDRAAQEAKEALSSSETYKIVLDGLWEGQDFEYEFERHVQYSLILLLVMR